MFYNADNKDKVIKKILLYNSAINIDSLIGSAKETIIALYKNLLSNNIKEAEEFCNKETIQKLLNDKNQFRITDNMDSMLIQFIDIQDFNEKNNEYTFYTSIVFYDDVQNNADKVKQSTDLYFNDSWIIKMVENHSRNYKCPNCGAPLIYDDVNNLYNCEYCSSKSSFSSYYFTLRIVDIERQAKTFEI